MSGRKRSRGDDVGPAAAAAAWEPTLPSAADGAACLGSLFGGGDAGLQALVRRAGPSAGGTSQAVADA